MNVTIVKRIFLHSIELNIPEHPTQEQINKVVEDYLKKNEIEDPYNIDWDETDYFGNRRIEVYDDYSGIEIYNSIENGT